jgi:hypothetical protein
MDLYRFGDHESWLLKIRFRDHKINPDLKGSIQIVDHESSKFLKIWTVFTNPTNPHKYLVLYHKTNP